MRKQLAEYISAMIGWSGLQCVRTKDYSKEIRRKELFARLCNTSCEAQDYSGPIHGVIFSMDRACQLHALLTSFFDNVEGVVPLTVLYRAGDERHARAYAEVQQVFADRPVSWVREQGFRKSLSVVIREIRTRAVFFLVDDVIVIRPFSFGLFDDCDLRACVPSLRLGTHLDYCYTKQRAMQLPPLQVLQSGSAELVRWKWQDGELDWGYPLSVDGNVFLAAEISAVINAMEFSAPNSFERELQLLKEVFLQREGLCFAESRIVNIPANRVQDEIRNLHGVLDAGELLQKWEDNYRIDTASLYGQLNRSVHQELPLRFVKRS